MFTRKRKGEQPRQQFQLGRKLPQLPARKTLLELAAYHRASVANNATVNKPLNGVTRLISLQLPQRPAMLRMQLWHEPDRVRRA